jgi:hypothetical protein
LAGVIESFFMSRNVAPGTWAAPAIQEAPRTAVQLESERRHGVRKKSLRNTLVVLLIFYFSAWLYTGAHFMADTNVYTQAVLRYQHGEATVDYRLSTSNPFWDFGHLLWRPLGWLGFVVSKPIVGIFGQRGEPAEVLTTLISINFLAALSGVVLFFLLAARMLAGTWPALLATIAFCTADAFLDYAHSGNAYVVGLACLVGGMYLSSFKQSENLFPGQSILAGVMYALAVLFWLPYVFVLPAAIALPLMMERFDQGRLRFARKTLLACAVVGLIAYFSAMAAVGIRNIADFRAWALASGHGQIQPGGWRALARLGFSLPRSFINMDNDGMWLKRYMLHDPYAPVRLFDLFRLSWWKLALFYASLCAICLELLRARKGRLVLSGLFLALVPIVVFAIFIFEAGSIERYLPLFPFLFLALGYVLDSDKASGLIKGLLIAFLICTLTVNIAAMSRTTLAGQRASAMARIHDLIPLLKPNSLLIAINEQDNLAQFRQNFPLDPVNLDAQWQTYDLLEINTARLATWQQDFAKRAVGTWRRGGSVWLPARLLQARPSPNWGWVEGDDKRVSWNGVHSFFARFNTGPAIGEDGFVEFEDNLTNREILAAVSQLTGADGLVQNR